MVVLKKNMMLCIFTIWFVAFNLLFGSAISAWPEPDASPEPETPSEENNAENAPLSTKNNPSFEVGVHGGFRSDTNAYTYGAYTGHTSKTLNMRIDVETERTDESTTAGLPVKSVEEGYRYRRHNSSYTTETDNETVGDQGESAINRVQTALTYEKWIAEVVVTGKLEYQFRQKWFELNTLTVSGSNAGIDKQSFRMDTDTDLWKTTLKCHIPYKGNHLITGRIDFKTAVLNQDGGVSRGQKNETNWLSSANSVRGKDLQTALEIQDEWEIIKPLTLYYGFRYDYWQAFDGVASHSNYNTSYKNISYASLSPKISITWQMASDTYVRAAIAKSFGPPTIDELYSTWISDMLLYRPNPELLPEKELEYEIGVDQYFWNRRLHAALTFFAIDITDAIESYRINDESFLYNIAEEKIQGAELSLRLRPSDSLHLWSVYTYRDTQVIENKTDPDTEGDVIAYEPETDINVGIDAQGKWFSSSFFGEYVGNLYTPGTTSNNFYEDFYYTWLWNIAITFTPVEHVKLSVSVENIFNQQYYDDTIDDSRSYFVSLQLKY